MKTIFEVNVDELNKKAYTLSYFHETGKVRLVGYKELRRENTRKRKYTVVRWYDWYNHRDRHYSTFIPIEQIELPQSVKQAFVEQLIERLTFITTEG